METIRSTNWCVLWKQRQDKRFVHLQPHLNKQQMSADVQLRWKLRYWAAAAGAKCGECYLRTFYRFQNSSEHFKEMKTARQRKHSSEITCGCWRPSKRCTTDAYTTGCSLHANTQDWSWWSFISITWSNASLHSLPEPAASWTRLSTNHSFCIIICN